MNDPVRIRDAVTLAEILRASEADGLRHRGGWGIECRSDCDASGGSLAGRDGRRLDWEERRRKDGTFLEALLWFGRGASPSPLEWSLLEPTKNRP
jgi:hypothetical protein